MAWTASRKALCRCSPRALRRDIAFLDLTHTDKVGPKRFWAVDGFHPGPFGYVVMADAIMRLLFDGAKE